MSRRALLLVIAFLMFFFFVYLYSNPILKGSFTFLHSKASGLRVLEMSGDELWVEVHDVSPPYLDELEEVVEVLDEHPGAYSRIVLFVIPNHGGVAPMHEYPEFISTLQALEGRGYILGVHGYTHRDPMLRPGFRNSRAGAERLLRLAEDEFNASGLRFPSYFLPPGWQTTMEVDALLRERFDYIYYYYYIDSPMGIIPSQSLEYVWHDYSYRALERAQWDYSYLKGVRRLTIHLDAVNSEKGLTFLHEYLGWIEEKE